MPESEETRQLKRIVEELKRQSKNLEVSKTFFMATAQLLNKIVPEFHQLAKEVRIMRATLADSLETTQEILKEVKDGVPIRNKG